jgi:hypothetical protein
MRFTIYLEARHHPIGPPTDPKLGQENGAACCLSLPTLPSEAIIQRYTLLHLNHSRLVRFSVCPSHLRSLAHALRIARTLLRVLTAALRTALVLLRLGSRPAGFGSLHNNLLHRTQKILPALPKMHALALGGGTLASLRVVCPGRLQRHGTKGDFTDGNHVNSNRTAEQLHQPDPSWRLHRGDAENAHRERRFRPYRPALLGELSRP